VTGVAILVVEDEPRNQALIQAVFSSGGYDVAIVPTIGEARAWVAAETPDLVLLDLRLPDEPGVVLARELRARPETRSTPILAVTASVLEADRREALEAGCDAFVEKPISPRELLSLVRARLEGPAGGG
jgi:DNA-binding response OmpR family regulator